jgi:hypothetical protein
LQRTHTPGVQFQSSLELALSISPGEIACEEDAAEHGMRKRGRVIEFDSPTRFELRLCKGRSWLQAAKLAKKVERIREAGSCLRGVRILLHGLSEPGFGLPQLRDG